MEHRVQPHRRHHSREASPHLVGMRRQGASIECDACDPHAPRAARWARASGCANGTREARSCWRSAPVRHVTVSLLVLAHDAVGVPVSARNEAASPAPCGPRALVPRPARLGWARVSRHHNVIAHHTASLGQGDPEIDTQKVDSTMRVEEYDPETQSTIRKIMVSSGGKVQAQFL